MPFRLPLLSRWLVLHRVPGGHQQRAREFACCYRCECSVLGRNARLRQLRVEGLVTLEGLQSVPKPEGHYRENAAEDGLVDEGKEGRRQEVVRRVKPHAPPRWWVGALSVAP